MKELDELLIKPSKQNRISESKVNRIYNKTLAPGYMIEEINGILLRKPCAILFAEHNTLSMTDYDLISESIYDLVNTSLERVKASILKKFSAEKNPLYNIKKAIANIVRKVTSLNILKRIEDKSVRPTSSSKMKASRFVNRYLQSNRSIRFLNTVNKITNNTFTLEQLQEVLARVLSIPDVSEDILNLELHMDVPVLNESNIVETATKLLSLSTILSIASIMLVSMYDETETILNSSTTNKLIVSIVTLCLTWANVLFTTKKVPMQNKESGDFNP